MAINDYIMWIGNPIISRLDMLYVIIMLAFPALQLDRKQKSN